MAYEYRRFYIDGQWVDPAQPKEFEVINPATEETAGVISMGSTADVDRAVQSARDGQREWAALTAMQRSRILRRAVEILRERNDELAALETRDTGKAIAETRAVDIVN